ncbi:hypothetical protein Vretimale_12940 [Volvox reticuliferus]|uniref:Choice-of-anchor I domain-containing protein n=1 Tax=Volvox reticuliferus TaxID=1737510 RepID=A0A8J4GLB8_9CHLO|nr:hypothetical protein Vretifemale_9303 [Volvox reticuliferus]GIM09055.1 hypothetical protein Vretimale_12940 [Volvox reticuliferus]
MKLAVGLFSLGLAVLLVSSVPIVNAQQEFSGCIPKLGLSLKRLSSLKAGAWEGAGAMEVMDYDPFSKLAAIVEARRSATTPLALLIVNYANVSAPFIHRRIMVSNSSGEGTFVGTPNSVSVWNGFAALSLDGVPFTASGILRVYHMASGAKVGEAVMQGCSMPDSIQWSKDGSRIVVACEGEPTTQEILGSDPEIEPNPSGAIAIANVTISSYTPAGADRPVANFSFAIKLLDFQVYIDSLTTLAYNNLLDRGLRIDPRLTKVTAAKDIEPEYITLHSDPNVLLAYVTVQENNAVASIDLTPGQERILSIWPLGLKDWGNTPVDPSDVDGTRIRKFKGLYSWYQPDTIVHSIIGGKPYLFIANEGDTKAESRRVKELANLDSTVFPNVTTIRQDNELGRLTVDPLFGIKKGYDRSQGWDSQTKPYNRLIAYGGRSWSILDATNGQVVFESGSQIETTLAAHPAASLCFNTDRDRNDPDSRSDNAGPEPEALEVFQFKNKTYAAIGLERMGGMLLYDVTVPKTPVFGAYVYNRNFAAPRSALTSSLGDLAPEGIRFVEAKDSRTGNALLLVSNEISATVSAWEVRSC